MNHFEALGDNAMEIKVEDKLTEKDYEVFKPLAESRIKEHGNVNFLLHINETPRFTAGGLWKDLKFDVKHYNDVDRLAVVSKDNDKDWLARISKPFTSATVKSFAEKDIDTARAWVKGEAK